MAVPRERSVRRAVGRAPVHVVGVRGVNRRRLLLQACISGCGPPDFVFVTAGRGRID